MSKIHEVIDIPPDHEDENELDEDEDDEEELLANADSKVLEHHHDANMHVHEAHEALLKIKTLPEPMSEKRARKLAIKALPKEDHVSWKMRYWDLQNAVQLEKITFQHRIRNLITFQHSLRQIEVKCGTSIVNVFLFIKWTLFLNLAISIMIILFICIPYLIFSWKSNGTDSTINCAHPEQLFYNNTRERMECCTAIYYTNSIAKKRGSITDVIRLIHFEIYKEQTNNTVERTPFFYGFYIHKSDRADVDYFAATYVSVYTIIMLFCLILMVQNVGAGVEKLIMAGEGDFYKYANLIFAGWDHYTRDPAGAAFKSKILAHEMSIALKTEKTTLASVMRNKRGKLFLNFKRVCVNLLVLCMIAFAGYIIFTVSGYSLNIAKGSGNSSFASTPVKEHVQSQLISFAPSLIISFFNLIFPIILAKIGKWEEFSPEKATALVLIRALTIRLLSIGFAAVKFYIHSYCEVEKNHCIKCNNLKGKPFGGEHIDERRTCWESMFADQIYKLMLVDLLLKTALTFIVDPLRRLLKRNFKHFIFQRIGTMKFNIVRHSLDMIYLQVLSWLGMYFGPMVPVFAVFYSYIAFYLKKYSVLFNCTAVPDTFKTMRTTTIFVGAKLLSFVVILFVNVGVIGYMIPSRGCGPFRQYDKPWDAIYAVIKTSKKTQDVYDSIASPGVTTPIVISLSIICYYFFSVAMANREMVDTLRHLLIVEGHDKQYLFSRLNGLRTKAEEAIRERKEADEAKRLLKLKNLEQLNMKEVQQPIQNNAQQNVKKRKTILK